METDLKKQNNLKISALLSAAILVCAGFQHGFDSVPTVQEGLFTGTAGVIFSAVLVLLTNLLPHSIKHKLVFLRFVNEMPGCRVDRLCKRDSRLVFEDVSSRWPRVFDESASESQRNALWYRDIYKPVKNSNEVLQSHRSFLLYRDTLSGLVVLLICTGLWEFLGNPQLFGEIIPAVYLVLVVSALLAMIAAHNAGNRFVVNAVAVAQ
jgi:hypothetical protein